MISKGAWPTSTTIIAAGAEIDHLDGITVSFPTWWFNVRSSNTEPLLRLNVEADSPEELEERRDEVLRADSPVNRIPAGGMRFPSQEASSGCLFPFYQLHQDSNESSLDRAEDPGQTLDYSYQKQNSRLQNLRRSIADVVTSEKRLELQEAQINAQIEKLDGQARQALSVNREDLAHWRSSGSRVWGQLSTSTPRLRSSKTSSRSSSSWSSVSPHAWKRSSPRKKW